MSETVQLNLKQFKPMNYDNQNWLQGDHLMIKTVPNTDFWSGTYYGLYYDNAPALLMMSQEEFWTLEFKASFLSTIFFDQCGVFLFVDKKNWLKAGIEYQNNGYQQLFGVVTNEGFSDWSMVDYDRVTQAMYYRLHRRKNDFLIEYSKDGKSYQMFRMFHLNVKKSVLQFGFFASSPGDSSFCAYFSEIRFGNCLWEAHDSDRF